MFICKKKCVNNVTVGKIVRIIGGATFGIYLIHDNVIMREVIWNYIINWEIDDVSIMLPLKQIYTVLIMFMVCLLLDLGRRSIFAFISKRHVTKVVLNKLEVYDKKILEEIY